MNIYSDPFFYDLEYDIRKDDIIFYIEQCQMFKSSKPLNILELGCGTGRISAPLARCGFNVTGVDIDKKMLKLAEQKSHGLGIEFIETNFIDLNLGRKFDVVLMPYNAFQHIHSDGDVNKFFNNLKTHMKQGSRFIMEVMNPLEDDLSRGPDDFMPFDAFYVKRDADGALKRADKNDPEAKILVIEDTVIFDPITKIANYNLYYSLDGEDLFTKSIDLRMYSFEELKRVLLSNDFNILNVYGDFNKSPLKDDSQSIVLFAELKY